MIRGIDERADKSDESALTPDERVEYETKLTCASATSSSSPRPKRASARSSPWLLMNGASRQEVRRQANFRCEYCRRHERHLLSSAFHLDHTSLPLELPLSSRFSPSLATTSSALNRIIASGSFRAIAMSGSATPRLAAGPSSLSARSAKKRIILSLSDRALLPAWGRTRTQVHQRFDGFSTHGANSVLRGSSQSIDDFGLRIVLVPTALPLLM